jgi:ribA/ribD-fused uncharacterized protein
MNPIHEFQGEHRFLSNFWLCPVRMPDEITYLSAEHAYQAHKTLDMTARRTVAAFISPGNAKRYGRNLVLRPNWEQLKDEVMLEVVRRKFRFNEDLMDRLLATGNALLEEGNHWGDRYWGVSPARSGVGQNKLGKILMRVREELRQ